MIQDILSRTNSYGIPVLTEDAVLHVLHFGRAAADARTTMAALLITVMVLSGAAGEIIQHAEMVEPWETAGA